MSRVDLKDLRKSYGGTAVVHGIDLHVEDGEFMVLVGPSGCGKSTILRMIAGLEEVTSGKILIDEREVNSIDPKGRNVAMVFQNYALYPHMTVRENIGLNLKLSRVAKDEIARRVAEAAEMLDITPLLDRRPAQLSGGQRQRVAMGRAMVRDPAVFLFDEPLSNLDAKLRVQMRAEIKNFHRATKATSIYVTHDQIEAMTLADRVAVFNGGRIEQVGDPISLYEKPDNVFVAGFIGSPAMNIIDARISDSDGYRFLEIAPGWSVELESSLPPSVADRLTIGIRPEHMTLTDPETGPSGTIVQIEITGAQTALEVDISGCIVWILVNHILRRQVGDQVHVGFDPTLAHIFDANDGKRLGTLSTPPPLGDHRENEHDPG